MLPARLRFPALVFFILAFPGLLRANKPNTKPHSRAEAPSAALKKLLVFPPRVLLDGPRDQQTLGVLGEYADGRRLDLTRQAKYTSSSPKVVRVEEGVLRPAGDGKAEVTVRAGGLQAAVPVQVKRAAEVPVSF